MAKHEVSYSVDWKLRVVVHPGRSHATLKGARFHLGKYASNSRSVMKSINRSRFMDKGRNAHLPVSFIRLATQGVYRHLRNFFLEENECVYRQEDESKTTLSEKFHRVFLRYRWSNSRSSG